MLNAHRRKQVTESFILDCSMETSYMLQKYLVDLTKVSYEKNMKLKHHKFSNIVHMTKSKVNNIVNDMYFVDPICDICESTSPTGRGRLDRCRSRSSTLRSGRGRSCAASWRTSGTRASCLPTSPACVRRPP